ncbi:MAG: glycine cleavage system aminomethyltransferase GcvT [Bacteroidetes bacterium]|nr:glycine cleavage system aminomethyltransferase GcvT [Bacteroidota bacterium]
MSETPLKYTPLNDLHILLGAKMVPFAGYSMPVQYSGIIEEHKAVRHEAGLFDVSHMGEISVTGPNALAFIQQLITNDASTLYDGKALYSAMCNAEGGIIDDLLVYRIAENDYLLVINAGNIDEDWAWMQNNNAANAVLKNRSSDFGLLALQGPAAFDILKKAAGFDASVLKYYHFACPDATSFLGLEGVIVSRTGYTGEVGVEIYCAAQDAAVVWNALMQAGQEFGLKPTGLGARDTLRLESGFCLHGNDISKSHNPIEAGLGWVTKLDKDDFNGKDVLVKFKNEGPTRKLIGFVADERGIPRHGYEIQGPDGRTIGEVTSGTQSPIMNTGIGMGYVENKPEYTTPGSAIQISARGKVFSATVQKPPFHKSN